MSDEADMANDRAEQDLERAISAARGDIPTGIEGECDLCGEHSARLIDNHCAPCRDRYHLA